jgi:hypothetical protein
MSTLKPSVSGSRNSASKSGRKKGSKRRSMCTSIIDRFDIQLSSQLPVFAGGRP